jgi:hypothetical protein
MEDEILNIQYHVKILLAKALSRAPRRKDAAALLGISLRTLTRYINIYL